MVKLPRWHVIAPMEEIDFILQFVVINLYPIKYG